MNLLPELASNPVVGLLAVIGGAALIFRLGGAVVRLVLAWAEWTAVSGLAEVSRAHGDLTTLAERSEQVRTINRARTRAGLAAAGWAAALAVPVAAGVVPLVYAPAALVWLLPRRPLRLTTAAGAGPPAPR